MLLVVQLSVTIIVTINIIIYTSNNHPLEASKLPFRCYFLHGKKDNEDFFFCIISLKTNFYNRHVKSGSVIYFL